MDRIRRIRRNDYDLFVEDEKSLALLEKVLNQNYVVLEEYKNSERNYVAKIRIGDNDYVLKENRKETRKWNYKIRFFFQDSEELQMMKNGLQAREESFFNLPKFYGVVEKRKYRILNRAFILEEYINGGVCESNEKKDKAVACVEALHRIGRYHGDCNPNNFVFDENGQIFCLDTKFKRMFFGRYQAYADMINMQYDSYPEMIFPYKINFWYHLALRMKMLRKRLHHD
jgi:heptose II phosphotransferase